MSTPFDELVKVLWNEVAELHAVYQLCRHLEPLAAGEKTNTRALEAAPIALAQILMSVHDDLILRVARLCDNFKDRTYKDGSTQRVLALKTVIEELPDEHENLRDELCIALERAREKAEPLEQHRNNRIGHLNRDFATGGTLPALSYAIADQALAAIRDFMALLFPDTRFDLTKTVWGGGDHLMRSLENATRFCELQRMAWDPEVTAAQLRAELQK